MPAYPGCPGKMGIVVVVVLSLQTLMVGWQAGHLLLLLLLLQPFHGPLDCVRDYPGELVPEWWNQSGLNGARDSEWQWHQLGHMQRQGIWPVYIMMPLIPKVRGRKLRKNWLIRVHRGGGGFSLMKLDSEVKLDRTEIYVIVWVCVLTCLLQKDAKCWALGIARIEMSQFSDCKDRLR